MAWLQNLESEEGMLTDVIQGPGVGKQGKQCSHVFANLSMAA